ncbi:GNAT family N-acetyltransferase [Synechococcus sp. MU1617]|uniref:GNAT family N-acetyltransferase n=1 Tax=Synechococcus sp. MU1617 TaxID=2508346 RepID=UPI001CF8DE33|nr:GNAT family N-acetyltransferase [Synechococcus sp. MU1617]MCB4389466.1 GNAT family N-acetyltransferase [Synechococcus sp. MU1617]
MPNKYTIEECIVGEDWDKIHSTRSTSKNIFLSSTLINSLDVPIYSFYICKGNEKLASFVAPMNRDKNRIISHDFFIYNGITHFSCNNQNKSQILSMNLSVQEELAKYLDFRFDEVIFSTHPSIKDIRSFLWHNYNTNCRKFEVEMRFTSYIHLDDEPESFRDLKENKLFRNCSSARKQEIRYSQRKGVTTEMTTEISSFVDLYRKTFERQNISVGEEKLIELKEFLESLNRAGLLLIFNSYSEDGNLGSIAIFLVQHDQACYLYGASDPEQRGSHTGTAVLWEAFEELTRRNVEVVDLEGINSPKRGWFKTSFGGTIERYFSLALNNK